MKNVALILLIFPLFCFSQNDKWDAVYSGTTEISKIYKGDDVIWEKESIVIVGDTLMTMTTTSTSSIWSPQLVAKTGDVLHWYVTGAVTDSYDGNDPTFDFSTTGTKNILVTTTDGTSGFTQFDCNSNSLTSLDVLNSTALTYLYCYSNSLTSLDVSTNTDLTYLYCHSNSLTSLDVSTNTALTRLYCYSNSLTSLDLSTNTALTRLDCYSNSLTSLDVSNNTALTYLYCYSNNITQTDIDGILCDLDSHGLSNGRCYVYDNTAPSSTGETCKTSLQGKGWTVTTD